MLGEAKVDILVVDDDPAGLLALTALLEPLGQNVLRARSGEEALRVLLDHDCALILLDVQMPEMNGLETASLIRKRERTSHTPIIFLTAGDKIARDVFRGYSLGAVDYLFKPIDPHMLRSKVSVFVELALRRQETQRLLAELHQKNRDLVVLNAELADFSHSVAHDLRAPLRSMDGFSRVLLEEFGDVLGEEGQAHLDRIRRAAGDMSQMIDGLLVLARATRAELRVEDVDLSAIARTVMSSLKQSAPERQAEIVVEEGLRTRADPRLMRVVLENLLGNAWKFTSKRDVAHIELRSRRSKDGVTYTIRDDGAGFEMAYADKLFGPFRRLHSAREFEGNGIGLATVLRIVRRHGGRVWGEGQVGKGAVFSFTLNEQAA